MNKKKKMVKAFNCTAIDLEKPKVHVSLQAFVGYSLIKAGQKLRYQINEILKEYDLIAPHLGLLTVIESSKPMSQIALGEELSVDKATMVKLLDDLEENHFIERVSDTHDRRIKFIKLTKEGKKFTVKMKTKRLAAEKKFLSVLTTEEEEILRRGLLKLLSQDIN